MRVWYFSEMAYHPAWEEGLQRGSLRVVLPNSNYDPQIGHQLLQPLPRRIISAYYRGFRNLRD